MEAAKFHVKTFMTCGVETSLSFRINEFRSPRGANTFGKASKFNTSIILGLSNFYLALITLGWKYCSPVPQLWETQRKKWFVRFEDIGPPIGGRKTRRDVVRSELEEHSKWVSSESWFRSPLLLFHFVACWLVSSRCSFSLAYTLRQVLTTTNLPWLRVSKRSNKHDP